MRSKIRKNKRHDKKGFSLLELIIAIFIFSLVMMVVVSAFLRVADARKRAKGMQQNLENMQYAMELMAKSLRTGSMISAGGTAPNIQFFENSQGKCIEYAFQNNRLQYRVGSGADKASCSFSSAFSDMTNEFVTANSGFKITPSSSSVLGRVTVVMEICSDASCSGDKSSIQTTVSLRDYDEVNP